MKTAKAKRSHKTKVNGGSRSLERLVRALGDSWARRGIELNREKDEISRSAAGVYLVCELQLYTLLKKYRAEKRKRSNDGSEQSFPATKSN